MEMPVVEAEARSSFKKGANRRLRAKGLIPAIVYGERQDPIPVAIDPKILIGILRSDLGANTIFELRVKGSSAKNNVMVKDYQLEPIEHSLLHADLIRVAMDHALTVHVHVELVGAPVGVKQQGGILEFVTRSIDVSCLPKDIPERIEVDVSDLKLGGLVRANELKLSDKVKLVSDPAVVIAHVVAPRIEAEPTPAEAAPAAVAEPEVIKRGKAATEEKEEAAPAQKPKGKGEE